MKSIHQVLSERREARKEALARFVECREYGSNPYTCHKEVGRDIMQLLVWYMRNWVGKHDAGVQHNQERIDHINGIQRRLGHPLFRYRFIATLDMLISGFETAWHGGLITSGNVVSYGGGQVKTEDSFDETVPAQRAYKNILQMREDTIKHPFLWIWCFVLRRGELPPELRVGSAPQRHGKSFEHRGNGLQAE